MKFEGDIENSFAKAIRSDDFSVNLQALKMATSAMSQGSEIDFEKIVNENEISERLADLISFAPLDDYANFDIYQGGERAYRHLLEILVAKPKEHGNDNYLIQEDRWAVLTDLDQYMSNVKGVAGNANARSEINISKTQFEMYKKMLDAESFDISIALSIHKMSCVLDKLSPEYVKRFMNHEDVKAVVATLDDSINDDIVYGELSYEVSRFIKANRLSSRKPHVLFGIMTTFANAAANGETEEEVLKNLREVGLVEERVINKYCLAIEKEKAKASAEFEDQQPLVEKVFVPLADRLHGLDVEEKAYFTEVLKSGAATESDVKYITTMLEMPSVTDEETRLMEEFDRIYDEEVEGVRKKKFGFRR